jgi:transcriptional regulator with XRE-family HTH domain
MFGKVVRRLREAAALSQETFADNIRKHRNFVGKVERGETNITLDNINIIARGLKQPIWMLLRELDLARAEQASEPASIAHREPVSSGPSVYIPAARVAERRAHVREQMAGLLGELGELDRISEGDAPVRKDKRPKR